MKPDLHMHSTFSDGTDTPQELLEKVRRSDIDIFSLTDHDTCLGCEQIRENLKDGDPTFIDGIEFSCVDDDGKCHVIGYCCSINKKPIRDMIEYSHDLRMSKTVNRLNYLRGIGYNITDEEIREIMSNKNPGKPHISNLMVKKGFVKDKKEAFAIMGQYKDKKMHITPESAIDAILSSDGIPVLAHGILGDGSKLLTLEQIEARVKRLKERGLMGLECYYSTYTEEQKAIMLSLADKYNLMVTAGSDYHGFNKRIALGETNSARYEDMESFFKMIVNMNN